MLLATSWLTKWAVRPTMETMATMLRPREMRKVFASGAEEAIFAESLEVVVSLVIFCNGRWMLVWYVDACQRAIGLYVVG
jgi:hypothetical protein